MSMDLSKKDINHYNEILKDGVTILKQKVSLQNTQHIHQEIEKIRNVVMKKISSMPRPLKTYSDIAERQLNRLDYRCGFNAEIFNQVGEKIHLMIKQFSPLIDFKYYWGAIPSLAGSGPTDMHRDVYPVLNTSPGNDLEHHEINLPPYYYTAFIPLVDITPENGPTEFIKGSHRIEKVDEAISSIYSPSLSVGDIIIFDGRTLHRGTPNNSPHEKLIAYITFVANWYHDQTFEVNDYLFPELLK